jgi:NAD(P)H-quinone oxidoreductase subunit 5
MKQDTTQLFILCAAAAPLALIISLFIPSKWWKKNPRGAARLGLLLGKLSFALIVIASLGVMIHGTFSADIVKSGPFALTVYFDTLTAIIGTLVGFLVWIILHFSKNYLDGDLEQGRFTRWLCFTSGSTLVAVISGNLGLFALSLCSMSLGLHQLLLFYSGRPAAVISARKKFVISRIGDLCMIATLGIAYYNFGTWNFQELLHQTTLPENTSTFNLISILLVSTALLKSAQFPFHSWLPDTLETPTPVSALMHAGIINMGGYLIVRLNPIINLSPVALGILVLLGAFTALFASLVMLSHASVKRSLAFSTVAQMGFMMLQCGLGAYSLAILHIVAHSLYKAHAFLSSGSLDVMRKSAWTPREIPHSHPRAILLSLGGAFAGMFAAVWITGISPIHEPGGVILTGVFLMAISHLLWGLWSRTLSAKILFLGSILSVGVALLYLGLHAGIYYLLGGITGETLNTSVEPLHWLSILILLLFACVFLIQIELPAWRLHPYCHAAYVHARNGFYFNTIANRVIQKIWPVSQSKQ